MTEGLTLEIILAVVAASCGTLAIVGIVAFVVLLCQKQRKKRREQAAKKRGSSSNVHQHIDIGVIPTDTASVLSGDESAPMFNAGRSRPRGEDSIDEEISDDGMSESYFNDNDDSWSYAVVCTL